MRIASVVASVGLLVANAGAQPVVGLYPTYPAVGELVGETPEQQAERLRSIGAVLAGGPFEDDRTPDALRRAGLLTFGLVVLFQGEEHWRSHPESRPIMADGRPLFKDRWYAGVCPNQPWLRRQKLREIERMLRSGRYDMINLDFIRYPVHWEVPEPRIPDTCYCSVCLTKFQQDVGVSIPAEIAQDVPRTAAWIRANHRDRWHRWRAEQITSFCIEVKRLRDRIRPQTRISLAAVPWRPGDYNNAIYRVVGQDFGALADVVDVFNPMSYHVLNGRPVGWIGDVNAYLVRETSRPVWPFVIFSDDHPLDAEQWRASLRPGPVERLERPHRLSVSQDARRSRLRGFRRALQPRSLSGANGQLIAWRFALPRVAHGRGCTGDGVILRGMFRPGLALLLLSYAGHAALAESLPRIVNEDGRFRLLVGDQPFLLLGGQVHNSSGWPNELESVWPQAREMHANTIEIPIYWEDVEPRQGEYRFDTVDRIVTDARREGFRLVLLWFATWKNGAMDYAPEWVKRDPETYPRMIGPDGAPVRVLSPHSQANRDADARAFRRLMRRPRGDRRRGPHRHHGPGAERAGLAVHGARLLGRGAAIV